VGVGGAFVVVGTGRFAAQPASRKLTVITKNQAGRDGRFELNIAPPLSGRGRSLHPPRNREGDADRYLPVAILCILTGQMVRLRHSGTCFRRIAVCEPSMLAGNSYNAVGITTVRYYYGK
jgi:hypothetical protein